MDNQQFTILEQRLIRIESLLLAIQPKRVLRQTKLVDERSLDEQVEPFKNKYPPSMINKFLLYWTEKDRWKKEIVFDVSKRLERWKLQQEQWDYDKRAKQELKTVEEKPVHRDNTNRINTGFKKLFE